jgi:uncharacterized membrane protein YjgN (DUF898 family)
MESLQDFPHVEQPLVPAHVEVPRSYRFSFFGEGGPLFFLLLKNVLLTIVTLGIYAAWAKTNRRKFVWSNVELFGHRFVYTGTGEEIFIGYLKVLGCYAVFIGAVTLAGLVSKDMQLVVQTVLIIPFVILVPFAIYWSRAYLLSRTTWRGIRFSLTPGAGPFVKAFVVGYFLTLLTLGIYAPIWNNKLRRILTNNTRFGNVAFQYDGDGEEVFWLSVKGVLLTIVTLGIYAFWFEASLQRYYFNHTTFSGARGRFTITGGTLLKLFLINVLGTTLTLGLAYPWISVYTMRTMLGHLSFEGLIDFSGITQNAAIGDAGGDALANALDVGLGI